MQKPLSTSVLTIPFRYYFVLGVALLSFPASRCTVASDVINSDSPTSEVNMKILDLARKQIGDRYKYAGKGPDVFDCSGLVSYVYSANNIPLSGSSNSLSQLGRSIKISSANPGDLVFFTNRGKIFHVSIISKIQGERIWVIHSTSSRGVIEEDIMSSKYWKPKIDKIISLNSLKR